MADSNRRVSVLKMIALAPNYGPSEHLQLNKSNDRIENLYSSVESVPQLEPRRVISIDE